MSTAVGVNSNLIHFGGNGGAKPFWTLTIVQLLTYLFQKLSFIRKKHHCLACLLFSGYMRGLAINVIYPYLWPLIIVGFLIGICKETDRCAHLSSMVSGKQTT